MPVAMELQQDISYISIMFSMLPLLMLGPLVMRLTPNH